MIVWLASYPKSGNTWLRLFLKSYFSHIKNNFNLGAFLEEDDLRELNINYYDYLEIIKNWRTLQNKINLNGKTNLLKTHNAMCTINNIKFSDKSNTAGGIYLIRDPRDVLISFSEHLGQTYNEVLNGMLDSKNSELATDKFGKDFRKTIMGKWSDHYNSWINYKECEILVIKYENLINDTNNQFLKILKYLKKIEDFEINHKYMEQAIKNTSFKKLQKNEKEFGFEEASKHSPFFRSGKCGQWKTKLDSRILSKIEETFKKEMKLLSYL